MTIRRHDVEVASKGFATEAAAAAEIKRLRGSIPDGLDMFLDFFEEEVGKTVWCWKDDRTQGASQTFTSKRKALDAWRNDKLIFDPRPVCEHRRFFRSTWLGSIAIAVSFVNRTDMIDRRCAGRHAN